MRRRLFQRLQQRVEGMRAQHVHLVDQVHLVAAPGWRVLHVVEQLARVVDLGARSGIDFDQVDAASGLDFAATPALETGRRRSRRVRSSGTWRGSSPRSSCPRRACPRTGRRDELVRSRAHCAADPAHALARSSRQSCAAAICALARCMPSIAHMFRRGGSPRRPNFGARRGRYRCSLPGLTGLAARRREGTGADHHGLAERVGFEPTNTREDVTGIPVQRLRPLGHLSFQQVTD